MNETENLAAAFAQLQVAPGSDYEALKRRYRRLIMVWHPDRFTTADSKADAEEELKGINNAWDLLKKHYESASHNNTGPCACRSISQSTSSGPQPRPGPGRKNTRETSAEEEAARRSRERREQAEREEREKRRPDTKNATDGSASKPAQPTMDIEDQKRDERLRWRIAICMGVIWLVMSAFGFAVTGIKVWWTNFSYHWQLDHPAKAEAPVTTTETPVVPSNDRAVYDPNPVPSKNLPLRANQLQKVSGDAMATRGSYQPPRAPTESPGQATSIPNPFLSEPHAKPAEQLFTTPNDAKVYPAQKFSSPDSPP